MVAIAIYWRFANYAAEHGAEITFLSSLSGWGVLAPYNIIDRGILRTLICQVSTF